MAGSAPTARVESQPFGHFHFRPCPRRIVVRGVRRATRPVLLALGDTACENSPPDCFRSLTLRICGAERRKYLTLALQPKPSFFHSRARV